MCPKDMDTSHLGIERHHQIGLFFSLTLGWSLCNKTIIASIVSFWVLWIILANYSVYPQTWSQLIRREDGLGAPELEVVSEVREYCGHCALNLWSITWLLVIRIRIARDDVIKMALYFYHLSSKNPYPQSNHEKNMTNSNRKIFYKTPALLKIVIKKSSKQGKIWEKLSHPRGVSGAMTKCGSWTGSSSRKRTVGKNLRKPEYSMCLVTQSCLTLCDPMDCSPPGTSVHGDSSGRNTGVGCHALLQRAFNQGLNPGLPHCRQIPYHLSHQRSPRILEWVAYPFSKRSSQPWNWTRVSCIAGGFFTSWSTREAPMLRYYIPNRTGCIKNSNSI